MPVSPAYFGPTGFAFVTPSGDADNPASLIGLALVAAAPPFDGCPVVRRKEPVILDGEAPPLVVVVVGDQGDNERLWAGPTPADLVRYNVAVVLVTTKGAEAADDDDVRQWRRDAGAVINSPSTYSGVDGLNEVWAGGRTPFARSGLKATLNYSTLTARVEVIEDRSY